MAAGNALLALAGPVGWTIAGASVLTSVVLFSSNKLKMYEKKKEEIETVRKNTTSVKETSAKVKALLNETVKLRQLLNECYIDCISLHNSNFASLSYSKQMKLGTLVNNAKALSVSLAKTI